MADNFENGEKIPTDASEDGRMNFLAVRIDLARSGPTGVGATEPELIEAARACSAHVLYTLSVVGRKMFSDFKLGTIAAICSVLVIAVCHNLAGQEAQPGEPSAREARGLPPRAAPTDYQTQAKAGSITIAADFAGHGVPTPDAVYSTDDFVVVEAGLFGPPSSRLNLSYKDFSLRINGKKAPLPAQSYEEVFKSLKNPEWSPPKSKSSTSLNGGGTDSPAPVHMPMEMELAMEQNVRKASIPEGDRPLPEAGLIFFRQGGKLGNIHSIELIYNGAAGEATLRLQP